MLGGLVSLLDIATPPGAVQALMRTISASKAIQARAQCDLTSGLQRWAGWRRGRYFLWQKTMLLAL